MEYPLERIFQYLLKNGILKFFEKPVSPPSQCPRFSDRKIKSTLIGAGISWIFENFSSAPDSVSAGMGRENIEKSS